MSPLDPRERDLVKCEDMRIYAERAKEFLGSRSLADFQAGEQHFERERKEVKKQGVTRIS